MSLLRSLVMLVLRSPWLRALCLLAAAVIIVGLFRLGAEPVAVGLIRAPWDKLAHVAVYAALTILLWLGAGGRGLTWICPLVLGVGLLDEWHQSTLPGRSAELSDMVADGAGILIAAVALLGLRRQLALTA